MLEFKDAGHDVTIHIANDAASTLSTVEAIKPDVIVCPMLRMIVPEAVYGRYLTLIVHPGVRGDRGAYSLDWAILERQPVWGVTVLAAAAEVDSGPVWAWEEFSMPLLDETKSTTYRDQVSRAAVRCMIRAVDEFCWMANSMTLESAKAAVLAGTVTPCAADSFIARGTFKPIMKQVDRAVDWSKDTAECICRKIRAADSNPGVLDHIGGEEFFLFGAHPDYRDEQRNGGQKPGSIIGVHHEAICRKTIDGAVWITHLKRRGPHQLKLPATMVLQPDMVAGLSHDANAPCKEIEYTEINDVGYLSFNFYNGAMSTRQCLSLRDAFLQARQRPTKVIVLLGSKDFFSNGIHLNTIEAATDPALESWNNINAINDVVLAILTTTSHLTVAALRGNAGAGGVMMALAADYVWCREGVVLNPHYKGMGLYGSEYWTYSLPKRVGQKLAKQITDGCQPMTVEHAHAIGMIDRVLLGSQEAFLFDVMQNAERLAHSPQLKHLTDQKEDHRLKQELCKPLSAFRAEELAEMKKNFWDSSSTYHALRHQFVYRTGACRSTFKP
jgi:putative two-component system hydrogenase maturation factor HypX/HoxX